MEQEYLDLTINEPENIVLDNWIQLEDFINDLKNQNVLIVSNLDKFILNTDSNVRIGWYNVENDTPHNLHSLLTDIDYLLLDSYYFDYYENILTNNLRLMKFNENYKMFILDSVDRVMEYKGD